MKHLIVYANEAKAQVGIFDVTTGIVKIVPVMATDTDLDTKAMNLLKTILAAKPDEQFTIVANRGLVIPTLEAMRIWKFLVNNEYNATDIAEVTDYQKYLGRAIAAGLDIETIDKSDIEQLKALALGTMTNTWTDRGAIDFMLLLALSQKYKFRNFDSLLKEPDANITLSEPEKVLREVVAKIHENCKLPEIKFVQSTLESV